MSLGLSYLTLTRLRERAGSDAVRLPIPGFYAIGGPDAAEVFYNPARFDRQGVLPGPVKKTLFGENGIHGLDGRPHQARKGMFLSVNTPESVARLLELTGAAWHAALRHRRQLVLFDEAARVLTAAACGWAGAPIPAAGVDELARNLVAMVDGFATLGPRHVRARLARRRTELWAGHVIDDVRRGNLRPPSGSATAIIAADPTLDRATAAVELLNVVRPTVAVSWMIAYAAHALHTMPQWRRRLADGDPGEAGDFADEVRRMYPFTPFLAARVRTGFRWRDLDFPADATVLLDVYGIDHDPRVFPNPDVFDPDRYRQRPPGLFDLIPQGAGDRETGHRCPGEPVTRAIIEQTATILARSTYQMPPQDLTINLRRIPARPASGVLITPVRPWPTSALADRPAPSPSPPTSAHPAR
ncbi:cytochrome P450 [Hamadaea sp. NPDC051192]|uniref:cytochrome P450 n=1 Tax=Hamadaea sp. NPDC051192 TaxID=3154940 RepID=UPI003429952B